MANTYTQIQIHLVFVVKRREKLITSDRREEVQKIITGIVQNRGHKMLAVFCMPDHCHLLIGYKPSGNFSDLVRDIKAGSSKFINDRNWFKGKFNWQEGYGAFSYSMNDIPRVINYILNQEEHHKKSTFKEEYHELLEQFEVEYEEKYLFEF